MGHLSVSNAIVTKWIDVADYVKAHLNQGHEHISFLIYRPFRHGVFKTGTGLIQADDLSNGCLVKFNGLNTSLSPSLKIYEI